MAEKLVGGGGRKIKPKPADRNRSPKRGISFCRVAREGTGDFEPIVWQTSTLTQKAFVNYAVYSLCGRPPKFSPGCHGLPMEHYTHDSDRERRNFHLPWRVDDILDPDQWPLARSSSRGWPWPFSLWQLPLAFWFWSCLPHFPLII